MCGHPPSLNHSLILQAKPYYELRHTGSGGAVSSSAALFSRISSPAQATIKAADVDGAVPGSVATPIAPRPRMYDDGRGSKHPTPLCHYTDAIVLTPKGNYGSTDASHARPGAALYEFEFPELKSVTLRLGLQPITGACAGDAGHGAETHQAYAMCTVLERPAACFSSELGPLQQLPTASQNLTIHDEVMLPLATWALAPDDTRTLSLALGAAASSNTAAAAAGTKRLASGTERTTLGDVCFDHATGLWRIHRLWYSNPAADTSPSTAIGQGDLARYGEPPRHPASYGAVLALLSAQSESLSVEELAYRLPRAAGASDDHWQQSTKQRQNPASGTRSGRSSTEGMASSLAPSSATLDCSSDSSHQVTEGALNGAASSLGNSNIPPAAEHIANVRPKSCRAQHSNPRLAATATTGEAGTAKVMVKTEPESTSPAQPQVAAAVSGLVSAWTVLCEADPGWAAVDAESTVSPPTDERTG